MVQTISKSTLSDNLFLCLANLDEYQRYSPHHKRRLAMTPGITGLWQVGRRSKITDFEEVVQLDTEYIENWSMALDFRIIIKTVLKPLNGGDTP